MAGLNASEASAASRAVVPSVVGVLFGVISFLLLVVVGFFAIRLAFPEKPHSEAYDGFGDAMLAWHSFLLGMALWVCVSVVLCTLAGGWIGHRMARPAEPSNGPSDLNEK